MTANPITIWPAAFMVSVAAVIDIRTQRIPNWLVLPFLISGISLAALVGGFPGLRESLFGVLMAGLVFGFLRYMGGMGMGDVKLAAAVAAWVGFGRFVPVMVLTGLAGGLIAVVWALWAGFMSNALSGVGSLLHSLATRGLKPHPTLVLSNPNTRRMPYAPAIAIGTLLSLLAGF